jgi:hypothetical protein
MKKNFSFALMALLMGGLSMGFVACSNDDDDDENKNNTNNGGNTEEVMNADQTDEAIRAWAWVNVMTDETDQAANWQSKTYTATIGVPSANRPTARVIYVTDLADAKASFASIAGCSPEDLNAAKTVSAGEFGSMEWNISAQGAPNIATVNVNTKLMPELLQIIYCTEEQAPENATNITGNCYYRLGDVVQDQEGFYWVCVQPSFLGKKNVESYWMNVFNNDPDTNEDNGVVGPGMPQKYIYSKYNKVYNNNTILLPTGLKMDRRQNYNLANLMWALWDYDFLKTDGDLGLAGLPAKYHGKEYLRKVREAWQENRLWYKVFDISFEALMTVQRIRFFYYGYHWKIGSTAGVWIYKSDGYQVKYTGSLDSDDTWFEMKKAGYGFDIRRYVGDPNEDKTCAATNKDRYMAPAEQMSLESNGIAYWVVRSATGKQLDSNYSPYSPMKNVKEVFVYNKKYNKAVGAEAPVTEE